LAGHSAFSNIKHKKGRADEKRGKLFTKFAKEISVAAKLGGGDAAFNPRLRMAVDKAKSENMTKESIARAIKKGTGELDGVDYVEIQYDGYGPAGVAFIVEALTDNKNRTASSVRSIFSRGGGNLGETGSVGWMFDKKGIINISKAKCEEEKIMDLALEAGADDIETEGEYFTVITSFVDYETIKKTIEDAGIEVESSEITRIPQNTIAVTDEETAELILKLYDKLEDDDDVQSVYANFEIEQDILEKLMG
jgi:YebC/PmpR family DNA-binding regulatory protein